VVLAFAIVEIGDRLALEVFLRREDAYASLDEVVAEQRELADILYVAPIELDPRELSLN
jgi:hypothetical protein